jgi:hypothetical protein
MQAINSNSVEIARPRVKIQFFTTVLLCQSAQTVMILFSSHDGALISMICDWNKKKVQQKFRLLLQHAFAKSSVGIKYEGI